MTAFNTWYSFSSEQHNHQTSRSRQCNLIETSFETNRYGKYLITADAVELWNKIQKQLKNTLPKNLSLNKIKTIVSNFYLKLYQ